MSKSKFKNTRILDVGMGQGPWGAAFVRAGAQYYVGMDPDVCPPIHAKTRTSSSAAGKGSIRQCMKAYNKTSAADPIVEKCAGANDKYQSFDVTGVEMMKSYAGRLALLPGTFESLYDQLRTITFDYVLIQTVTEH